MAKSSSTTDTRILCLYWVLEFQHLWESIRLVVSITTSYMTLFGCCLQVIAVIASNRQSRSIEAILHERHILQWCHPPKHFASIGLEFSRFKSLESNQHSSSLRTSMPSNIPWNQSRNQGTGVYPDVDPWGHNFPARSRRAAMAGKPIASGFVATLEGIQADQDFVRILFKPERS